jgi:topoisomerase-4 subunit A
VNLTAGAKARKKVFDFDFAEVEIKGRAAGGNILTRYPVRKIVLKSQGVSTLGGLDVWYDESVGRLNTDHRGKHIGNYLGEDKILVILKDGSYELTSFELTNRYEAANINLIEKFQEEMIITALYYEGGSKLNYIKRFKIETTTPNKVFKFISEERSSKLHFISSAATMKVHVKYTEKGKNAFQDFQLDELIDVKGWRATGNKFVLDKIKEVSLLESSVPESEISAPEKPREEEPAPSIDDLKASIAKEVAEEEKKFDVGSSVDLNVKKPNEKKPNEKKSDDVKDQLGLFGE